MEISLLLYLIPVALVVGLLLLSINVLREYERGVVFFLGRFQGVKGPG
ncbi:MAG TPA: slipin family protein, partial [Gammaproteobacteria bacterium]|nr:slipin family protein [Gammaproteobacteria bacterium]